MSDTTLLASLQPLAASIDQAVTIVDLSGRVLEWNPAAEGMYGIARAEIIGRDINRFFSPASLMVRRVLETGRSVELTYHQPRPGIHVLVSASPVFADGRLAGAVAVERNVTRMVELSSELVAAQAKVAALEERLSGRVLAQPVDGDPFQAIRGRHPKLLHCLDLARRIAPTEAVTLLRGESGVGKELFARGIHLASRRARGPLVAINCGAIPVTLFESELFGYAPGAFTGASSKGHPGKLELADGGTLFLDEVGDLPPEAQVKLLRFLEDHRFYRLGGTSPVAVDVRIVAATHRPLEELVAQGRFRDDLYWRLNVITLELPPLRERKEDVADLVQVFVHECSLRHGRPITGVDPVVIQRLLQHAWPGNVRELRNTVERMVVLCRDGSIGPDLLPASLQQAPAPPPPAQPGGLQEAAARTEREEILGALAASGSNRTAAAKLLGVSRGTLYYKCRQLGIAL